MKQFFTLLITLLSINVFSQGILDIAATHVESPSGTLVEIDVTVEDGIWNCNGIGGSLHWDPTVAEYSDITDFGVLFNPDMDINDFDLTLTEYGEIGWIWYPTFTVGPTLVEGDLLFTIQFLLVGNNGSYTDVTFEDDPEPLYWNSGGLQTGTFDGSDGSITVGGLNLTGCYDPDNWTADTENTNGEITHTAGVITMEGDNDGTGNGSSGLDCDGTEGTITYCNTIPNDGVVTFGWNYDSDVSNANTDAFGYCLNGVENQLALTDPPPFGTLFGNAEIDVLAGDEFCFTMSSEAADLPNAPVVTITEFTGPPCELPHLIAEIAEVQNVACTGDSTGALAVVTEFGTEPITYTWDQEGVEGPMPTGLPAGEYCVTVIDAVPDTAYVCYTLTEADVLLNASAVSQPDDGFGTGMALVNVENGTGVAPYTVLWDTDPVHEGNIITGLDWGVYNYTVTDSLGCIFAGSVEVMFVGIEEIEGLDRFSMYPNPTSGLLNLNVEFDHNAEFTISIVNAIGQTVHQIASQKGSHFNDVIDLSNLNAGFYYLNLEVDGSRLTEKIIIQ